MTVPRRVAARLPNNCFIFTRRHSKSVGRSRAPSTVHDTDDFNFPTAGRTVEDQIVLEVVKTQHAEVIEGWVVKTTMRSYFGVWSKISQTSSNASSADLAN